ncbi:MAG: ATP-binding protein [Gemmatimonadales bacterium]
MGGVAVLGVLASIFAGWRVQVSRETIAREDFSRLASAAALRLQGRLNAYEEALHASAGFVMGSDSVSRVEWERFEETLRVPTLLPAASSMAYAKRLKTADASQLVFRVIDSELAGIDPGHADPLLMNGAREAVLKACTTGDIASVLWYGPTAAELDVALLRGVFEGGRPSSPGCGPDLMGVVFIQLHPEQLVQALAQDAGSYASFRLLPNQPDWGSIESAGAHQRRHLQVEFGGRTWYLAAQSTPAFGEHSSGSGPLLIVLGGLLTTLLATRLTGSELHRRRLEATARQSMERTLARTETALGQTTARSLETERRLANLIDSAMDAILGLDENGRIELVNAAAERMLHACSGDIVGQSLTRFLPPRMRDRYIHALAEINHGAQHRVVGQDEELVILRFDGEEFPAEATLSVSESEGRRSFVLIVRDLSERRAIEQERHTLEAQLRQSQKMEAIGTLAGGIAHDFNNLLGSILGNAEMATEELPPEHQAQEFVREIVRAGERARDLVRRILGFTRQQEQERKPVHLEATAEEVVRLLRATLPARIDLVTEVARDLPTVLADPGQLHQVLVNLITNSAYAIGEGEGRIRVVLRRLPAGSDPRLPESLASRDCLELSVRDTGSGMPPEVLERIFDPFFTTKPVGKGTGLGLSVVHGIVQQHEASIHATSTVGEGTMIRVVLPALEEEPVTTPREAAKLPRGNGERVLLVDDEEALRTMGEKVLRRIGYTPLVAGSAAEALEVLQNGSDIDILITDFSMPGLSGTDLAARAHAILPHLPIVLLTGYGLVATPDKLREFGIRAMLPKPVAIRALAETLATVNGVHGTHPGGGR